jgi:hypothetical protein
MSASKTTAKKVAAKPVKAPAKNTKAKAPAKAPKVAKAAPAKKVAAKKAPAAPKAVKSGTYAEMQANRFHESKVENPVRAMWDLCDAMVENRRKDVIAAAVLKGISYYTARTQYQLWLTAYRNSNSK